MNSIINRPKVIISTIKGESTAIMVPSSLDLDRVFCEECRKIDSKFPLKRSEFKFLLQKSKCWHDGTGVERFSNELGTIEIVDQNIYSIGLSFKET